MNKKYELTSDRSTIYGNVLYRIRALRDFGDVRTGDLGGWIKSETNLSHEGDCWVSDNACIYQDARVFGDAKVCGMANIYNHAQVYGNAQVFEDARIFGHSSVYENAKVYDYSWTSDNVTVCGNSEVFGYSIITGDACIYGDAQVSNVNLFGTVKIHHGTWNQTVNIHDNYYLISPTLQKILLGVGY